MESKVIEKITVKQLVTLLLNVVKGTFVNITMETEVRMNKTGNPYHGRITKVSTRNYLLGNSYENRVNKNMEKEGIEPNFESQKPFGKHYIGENQVVLMDDKTESVHYVMLEYFDEVKPQVEYFIDGTDPIEKQLFEDFLTKHYESKKQPQERKVQPITPKISNIVGITLNGTRYVLK